LPGWSTADEIAAALQAHLTQEHGAHVEDRSQAVAPTLDLLRHARDRAVPWEGWEAIEAFEIAAVGRRWARQVKVAERELLLAAALSQPSPGSQDPGLARTGADARQERGPLPGRRGGSRRPVLREGRCFPVITAAGRRPR